MHLSTKRVLLVDDEVGFSNLVRLNLEENAGCTVQVENNSKRAMDTARAFRPDVILLDVIMPGLSGLELGHKLRADSELSSVPIIFISAAISRENTEAWQSGIEGVEIEIGDDILKQSPVLVKPVNLQALLSTIEKSLSPA